MQRAELFEMGVDIVEIELTEPLPETCFTDLTYRLEGTVKVAGIGAPPWVYAEVRLKEWYKPGVAEEISYERGLPKPISGEFSIDLSFKDTGVYEVTVVATPAPLSLPVVGVPPVVGKSDTMEIEVAEAPPAVFRFSKVTIDGNEVLLTDHDADSGLLLEKTTADYLDITPAYEWTGPRRTATISIKAGYKDWTGGFSPKTGAYTKSITLPESPYEPYQGELTTPIRIPLTACGGLTDGAIEVVLKIAGEPDYISRIWNVYYTKAPPEIFDFDLTRPTPSIAYPDPGVSIDITCPITSRCVEAVDAHAKVIIYEGSLLPGHGSKIKEYDSDVFHIEPGESKNVVVHHTTEAGTIDRRDVEVEVYINTDLIKESEWDDVYYVGRPPEEEIDFELTRPYVSPAEITPGTAITITCPVTSACTKEQTVTAKVKIYEGSIYPGHGTLIATKTSPSFSIAPGQTYNVIVQHTAIAGTIDRRDVEVEVYIAGKLVKEDEWDDVYYVEEAPPERVPPEVETLAARDIIHDSARIRGELIDTGYWNIVDCYFEWGKTTSYGKTTPKVRMYEGDEGDRFYAELQHQLEPDTTYHYRAAAVTVGVDSELKGYGDDRTFTTEKEVVKGLTMRVVNARAGSVYWRACCVAGGELPCSNTPKLDEVWEWTGAVPDYTLDFFVWSGDTEKHTTQYDEFPFRLRPGKNYVWDFDAHEMRDYDTGEILVKTL